MNKPPVHGIINRNFWEDLHMKTKALYTGSFDPLTNGHLNIGLVPDAILEKMNESKN